MPGILPMKVIKVGTSSQARIAQACDRCRSKKIRCDGIRPCCSQCSGVGFECKTSDKLSRRAFPRGYTESLEDRVRLLEGEVRELKDLLDEKEEKIDMLSKMHSHRRLSHSSASASPLVVQSREQSPAKDDVFRIQESPLLLESDTSDSYFMGASSGRAFVDAFKRKVQESGQSCSGFNTEVFLTVQGSSIPASENDTTLASRIPPRLFSDRCINVFWQEWAPLFPVLNKPAFLRLYEQYMADPEAMTNNHKLAQLHLVFGIAGLSSNLPDKRQISLSERQWHISLEAILMDCSLETLQCLILAMIYCISKGDYKRLLHYRSISVGLSHHLGLNQNQKRFSFGALTTETRKKVFWTLYTIDTFSAALMGLTKLIKEGDVDVDFPLDLDDEYVTEKGYLPTLPGESSKISSALALFRGSRILSKVLERNYPTAGSHELSLQSLAALETELNEWSDNLPQHLKLTFVQDKPSTDITGSRSALLSLAYYYTRTLIHRPAVGSTLGAKASSSVISMAESSKHIIQIVQLLEERSMSFSFCLNKNGLLTLCGLSLLYQGLDLKHEGKLMKDGQRLVCTVVAYLIKANAPGAKDFRRLAASMMPSEDPLNSAARRRSLESNMIPPAPSKSSLSSSFMHKKQLILPSSISQGDLLQQQESLRRVSMPNSNVMSAKHSNHSQSSLESTTSEFPTSRREHRTSVPQLAAKPILLKPRSNTSTTRRPNLDYLSLSDTPNSPQPHSPTVSRASAPQSHTPNFPISILVSQHKTPSVGPTEWEALLSSLDGGTSSIYDAVYGGSALSMNDLQQSSPVNAGSQDSSSSVYTEAYNEWDLTPDAWDLAALNMGDFDAKPPVAVAQSVLSFSEESLSSSSGDDLASSADFGSANNGHGGFADLTLVGHDGLFLDGLNGNYGM